MERSPTNQFFQRLSFHQLHGDERLTFVLAHLINGTDVRMIQRCGSSRFALEPFEFLRVFREFFRQELQRHKSPERGVFGLVHHTHPAPAELVENSIMRNRLVHYCKFLISTTSLGSPPRGMPGAAFAYCDYGAVQSIA